MSVNLHQNNICSKEALTFSVFAPAGSGQDVSVQSESEELLMSQQKHFTDYAEDIYQNLRKSEVSVFFKLNIFYYLKFVTHSCSLLLWF